ncbi:N-acetyltransferase domain-containing protein OS=Streptomyces glaucescens OX=1907 GN=SGLAU_19300 PE=4 SV=1 [Streptomyces glaucescens]
MPSPTSVTLAPMTDAHADDVLAIYQAGIDEGNATFETTAPTWPAFDEAKLPEHRFVALDEHGTVLGWVAASRVSDRCAYAGVVEHSVYVHPGARGRGVASALLKTLIESAEAAGVWTIQSASSRRTRPASPCTSVPAVRVIGTRERIGRHHGRWRDVLLLERRSPLID